MEKTHKKRLVLLDAHALLHRAYHALPEFTNSKGEPTGGVYGFLSMILKIIADFSPDAVVACYDLPQKTFRHEAYAGYKGTRTKSDSALIDQITRSRELCEKLSIPIYDVPGFEADDILGTIVEQTKYDKQLEIIIATGDMDSLQLVDKDRVRVFTLKKGINDTVIYDEQAVRARFGFGPESLTDYKGLRGDPSDNIIGVPGIGEKTATDIILAFGTIEQVYETIRVDRTLLLEKGIKERIIKLLEDHEESALFSKTLATIRRDAPISFHIPKKTWYETFRIEYAEPLLQELEFKSLIVRLRDIAGVDNLSSVQIKKSETESIPVTQEAKIALWLIDSEKTNPDTDDIALATRTKDQQKALIFLEKEIDTNHLSFVYQSIEKPLIPILENMHRHGVMLDKKFLENYSKELHQQLDVIAQKIYMDAGREFNINSPKQLGEVLFGEMQIHAAMKGFKLKKTATGSYSTKESDLEKFVDIHPIITDILNYREFQKLLSTYIDNLPEMVGADGRLHPELIQTGAATGRFASQNPSIQNIPIRTEQGRKIRDAFVAPSGFSILTADYSQVELRIAAMLSKDPVLVETFIGNKDVHTSVAAKVFHVDESMVTSEMRRKAKIINFGILYGMGVTALQKNLMTTRAEAQQFYDTYFQELSELARFIAETIDRARKVGFTRTLFGRRRMFPALRSKIPFIKAMAERAASNAPIQGTSADIIKLAMIDIDRVLRERKLNKKIIMTMQIHDELVFEVANDFLDEAYQLIKETMEQVLHNYWGHVIDSYQSSVPVPLRVSISHGSSWGDAKN